MIRQRAKDGSYVRLGDEAPFGNGPAAANYKVDIYPYRYPIIKWISIRIHGQD